MTYPQSFPPGRSLAEWWGQVASLQPRSFWLAYLFLHRLDSRVYCAVSAPLDSLHALVMQAIDMTPSEGDFWYALDARLHVGKPALHRIVQLLTQSGLVEPASSGRVSISTLGREALRRGEYETGRSERRVFTFAERLDPVCRRLQPPHFVSLQGCQGEPWQIDESHQFDPAWLAECIHRPPDWKQMFAFPSDIKEMAASNSNPWHNIMIDRGEQVPLAFVESGQHLLGFAIHRETWKLLTSAPAIDVGENWRDLFPVLTTQIPDEAYLQAWRATAAERGVSEAQARECRLNPQDNVLAVIAPRQLGDTLRRIRQDSSKGQAWTLVGEGAVRKIMRIDIELAE